MEGKRLQPGKYYLLRERGKQVPVRFDGWRIVKSETEVELLLQPPRRNVLGITPRTHLMFTRPNAEVLAKTKAGALSCHKDGCFLGPCGCAASILEAFNAH